MKLRPVRILLIEDNEGDILLTREAFQESKVQTTISVARNGKEALDILRNARGDTGYKRPDLILLDINIPIFNGHQVLTEIKSDERLKKIPVIILTTSSNQNDIDKAYLNHCNSYVQKPLDMEEFLNAILRIEAFWLQLSTLSDE